ncbi:MAG: hypothetical protein RLY93_01890 [Sumerlaeia bacterium]
MRNDRLHGIRDATSIVPDPNDRRRSHGNRMTPHVNANGASADKTADRPRRVLCPYCGSIQAGRERCEHCKGLFEPLSRQATQNAMGPWQIRNEKNPFRPGCSFDTIRDMVKRGRITEHTIIRGPTTRQFWAFARDVPGVAAQLGQCHACHERVGHDDYTCRNCGVVLTPPMDRQSLGLGPVQLLPGQASPEAIASASMNQTEEKAPRDRPASPIAAATATPAPQPAERATPASTNQLRRLRARAGRLKTFLTVSLIANGLLLAVAAAIVILSDSPIVLFDPADNAATPSEVLPEATPAPAGPAATLDAESPDSTPAPAADASESPDAAALPEAWRGDFERAMELRREQTIDSLAQSVAILEDMLTELEPTQSDARTLIERTLDATRRELERLELREML